MLASLAARPTAGLAAELRGLVRLARLALRNGSAGRAGARRFAPTSSTRTTSTRCPQAGCSRAAAARGSSTTRTSSTAASRRTRRGSGRWLSLALEGALARRADAVVTVSEPIAAELTRRLRLQRPPLLVLNCPPLEPVDVEPRPGAPVRAIYQAAVGPGRLLDDVVDAARTAPGRRRHGAAARRRRTAARPACGSSRPCAPDALVAALAPYDIGLVIDRLETDNARLALPEQAVRVPDGRSRGRGPAGAGDGGARRGARGRRRLRARTARRRAAAARSGPRRARRDAPARPRARRLPLQRRGAAAGPPAAPGASDVRHLRHRRPAAAGGDRTSSARCWPSFGTAGPTARASSRRRASRSGTRGSRSSTSPTAAASRSRATTARSSSCTTARSSTTCELRAELEQLGHRFRTETDTEVVLRAYEEWGPSCVERFNGMWAFALWDDRRAAALLLARPLRDQAVRLPRSRRPVRLRERAAGLSPRPLVPGAARTRPRSGTSSRRGTRTTSRRRSSPASASCRRATRSRSTRTGCASSATGGSSPADPPADPVEAFRELFLDSIRLRLRSDVPLGTALSGGLDSSAVAVAIDHLLRTEREHARPVGERQRTFTAYFEDAGFDERPFAEAVVGQILSEPRWLTFDEQTLLDVLPDVVASAGRAVRVDERRRAVVRDARGGGGRAEGDARRTGRRRGAGRLPDDARLPARRPARRRAPPRGRRPSCGRSPSRRVRCRRPCSRRSCPSVRGGPFAGGGAAATCSSTRRCASGRRRRSRPRPGGCPTGCARSTT